MAKKPTGRDLPPDPLPVVAESPCVQYACRACCFDTRMPLHERDIERLMDATGLDRDAFTVHAQEGGAPRLKNTQGHCVFLGESGCNVYDDRPAGCRLYPLVLDSETGQGVLDPDCPYTRKFRIRPSDRAALQELVTALGLDPDR